jgi:hypothetical protein
MVLESGAGGDLTDFGIFDDAAAKIFLCGLEHSACEFVTVDVESWEWFQDAAKWDEEGVELGEAGGRLGVDESGAPAVGVDELDEIVFGLGLDAGPLHAALRVSSLPADVMEVGVGTVALEHVGGGERVGIADGAVVFFRDLRGGDTKAEKAGIDAAEGFFDGGVIQKILVDVSAELGAGVHQRPARDGADFVNDGGGEAGLEGGVADGTGGAEEEDFHRLLFFISLSFRANDIREAGFPSPNSS